MKKLSCLLLMLVMMLGAMALAENADVIEISTAEELAAINDNLSGSYVLTADIVGAGFYNEQVAQANGAPFDQPTQYELVDCAVEEAE